MLYSQKEIVEAALKAYSHSACSDPEYHKEKAQSFVMRCVRAHNVENDDDLEMNVFDDGTVISEDIIRNVCYAALDADCEAVFWSSLN